ncbi:GreA/GreB family elongation factor [Ancylobacter defluvii]|uniref:Transcription elongation factor GreB n=1 Tax=Ancylobacter defluvii TaxID=1282440 RepID=A0A9W6JWE3_9HYPH|nr:GreA/GreB family elongation factor [Ancylobacter defluvii]MBS7587803.1 GreA/GreB family elongation factor [Ancylobacter defluvii]GLK82613.1 transcription elongation factor GreB [Ancylobacter defluvii]
MSRAFVKEDSGAEALPERPVSANRNLVTRRGLALIEAEIARQRAALAAAGAGGERDAAARASRELRYWSARRASAEPVDPPPRGQAITFGMAVMLEDEHGKRRSFRIVGEDEAEPKEGRIAWVSPVARALVGKWIGDEIDLPAGTMEIVAVDPAPEAD